LEKIEFKSYFFNPNIHPYAEFKKRLETFENFAEENGLDITFQKKYLLVEFLRRVVGREGARCEVCFAWRMDETAKFAKANGCDAFTTTLLGSPYQKHDLLKEVCETVAKKNEISFHYVDWRDGHKRGIELSKAAGLYRQRYCGCIYSEAEREGVL